jgi:D-alanyl-lipoteichoic acid acyltransferase DltB (MBOAT superfamily)
MLFPTITFAVFFLVVYVANWLTMPRPRLWRWTILAASAVFYGWWDWRFVVLLAAAASANQFFARRIAAASGVGGDARERDARGGGSRDDRRARRGRPGRAWLVVAIVANVGVLGLFKYYDFFVASLDDLLGTFGLGTSLPLFDLVVPVGLSFLVFRMLTYAVDIYRGAIRPAPALDFAVYVAFFPYLLAGPIARAAEFLPQLRVPRDPRRVDAARAFRLILGGLVKKVLIADYLATNLVDGVFAAPGQYSSVETLVGIYAYAAQIYCDFSGYTDIAVGVALLLGFVLPENFDVPYAARSVREFWRRWHMTLSGWLRDYLYIPLGGNRRGPRRTARNIMTTMLLGGLWHGAGWTYVVWGGLHGGAMVLEHGRADRRRRLGLPSPGATTGGRVRQYLLTFHFVALAWVVFRADSLSAAAAVLARLVTGLGDLGDALTPALLAVTALGLGVQFVPRAVWTGLDTGLSRAGWVVQGLCLAGALFVIDYLGPQGVAEFIYFGF